MAGFVQLFSSSLDGTCKIWSLLIFKLLGEVPVIDSFDSSLRPATHVPEADEQKSTSSMECRACWCANPSVFIAE